MKNFIKNKINLSIQSELFNHIPLLLLALIIGILGGYGAVFFRFFIKYTQYFFYHNDNDILTFANSINPLFLIFVPAIGGLIVGVLIYFGAREAKGHGVPEVMEAVALRDGKIRKRVAIVKILASGICIGTGGSVGREGPIVQIGSGIGSAIGQIFKVKRKYQRTLVGCGAAAGIAATFNAPIAGVLFALEILLGEFGISAFSPVVLSSVIATTISRQYFGDFPAFDIPAHHIKSLYEFAFFPILGIVAGLVSIFFISFLYKAEDFFDTIKILPEYIKPAIGGLILGVIFLKIPNVFGVGYGSINLALFGKLSFAMLLLLIFLKIFATSLTIGSGGSGGVFAPSLFIGAMLGGAFGHIVNAVFPEIASTPGVYALIAMGAVVAGTTHAPITAILIIFELTNDYKIILPLMICCILSTIITVSLKEGSIYTIKLLRRGIDIVKGMEQNILIKLKVKDFLNTDLVTVKEDESFGVLVNKFKEYNISYIYMLDNNDNFTGVISFSDIMPILDEKSLIPLVIAKDVANTDIVSVIPENNLQEVLHIINEKKFSAIPVVDKKNSKKLLGYISERTIIEAYDNEIMKQELGLR